LCVDDLALAVDRARAATSQHLRVLREAGVVEGRRRGTTIYYRLRPSRSLDQVEAVISALTPRKITLV
jgi:ArsR family transcriptional regulator